jgi:hypothetical protein
MSFGGGGSNQSQSQSSSSYDPAQLAIVDQNAQNVQNAAAPGGSLAYTPYTGPGLSFGNSAPLNNLTNYTAPTVAPSTYTPSTIGTGQVNSDTQSLMNPYTNDVVDTTNTALARQNNIDNTGAAGAATAAGAFGGSRSAVLQNLNTNSYQANLDQTDAALESNGYTQAQNAALTLGQANQSAQNTAGQFNASQTQGAATANQTAANAAAQTQLSALGISSAQAEALFGANWQQYLNSQTDPQAVQQIVNQALGLTPQSPLNSSTTNSSGQTNPTYNLSSLWE